MKSALIIIYICSVNFFQIHCQISFPKPGLVFTDSEVPRVNITIDKTDLETILHPDNAYSYEEFAADFRFTSSTLTETVENVGFRIRGNTSRVSAKKSFKISFNTFESGRKFYGLEKMNINGEHNDPSIARSKICWDIFAKMYVPASRANHVRLYINNVYYGLYLNVEHIDEEFIQARFNEQSGNLYKCIFPAPLLYRGDSPNNYKKEFWGRRAYQLKTNRARDDYSDLAKLIRIINTSDNDTFLEEINTVFNIDGYLRYLAVEVAIGHWDGYSYNQNNFYLYHNTRTGKFEFIPYDLDNTLGIDFVDRNWATRFIYPWAKNGGKERPLTRRIMEHTQLRERFSHYMKILIEHVFHVDELYPKIDRIRQNIRDFVIQDPKYKLDYGFTFNDFENSFEKAWGNHVGYGIKPYIGTRRSSILSQLETTNLSPIIVDKSKKITVVNRPIRVDLQIVDEDLNPNVILHYQYNSDTWQNTKMQKQADKDEPIKGLYYRLDLPALSLGDTVNYFIRATDSDGNTSRYPQENNIRYSIEKTPQKPQLYINEWMSSNKIYTDGLGEYDDWFELYNAGASSVYLGNKYFSDNFNRPDKWQIPSMDIAPNEYLVFWADKDSEQGHRHTNFKLNAEGEQIGIFYGQNFGFLPIDTVSFSGQQGLLSQGRLPDGSPNIYLLEQGISPGQSNSLPTGLSIFSNRNPSVVIIPNPVRGAFRVVLKNIFSTQGKIIIYTIEGKTVLVKNLQSGINTYSFQPIELLRQNYFHTPTVYLLSVFWKDRQRRRHVLAGKKILLNK